jgi:RNA polymerase sigma factor (sigma-70 family)
MEKEREFTKLCEENKRSLMMSALNFEKNNKDNAEDLMQDTLLKAYKSFNNYKSDFKFSTWVRAIMKNNYIDRYRKNKDVKFSGLDTTDEMNICNIIPNGEDIKLFDSIHCEELMIHAERVLSDKLKKPFKMWLDSYAYKEISEEMDMPIGTVKNQIHLARTKIIETFPR